MEFRFSKIPHFYLILVIALILGVFLYKELVYKQKITIPLEPATVHRGGPTRIIPLDPKAWEADWKKHESIVKGADIFYNTARHAPENVGNALSCTQCHFNGGRQAGILGLLGVARRYPRYDPRAGREINLSGRIQSCFLRSENGKAPAENDPVVLHLLDYLNALSEGKEASLPASANFITIPKEERIAIASLDPKKGKLIFADSCAICHGADGQGNRWAPPLWGERSFNDGAGLARVYTLASFIRDAMPLGAVQKFNSEEAQAVAAYLNAQNRPAFSGKDLDYLKDSIPVDAVYYTKEYPQNPLKLKLEKESGNLP